MIYVDPFGPADWRYKCSCHMCADSLQELVVFALSIGLKHSWLHKDHFDLTYSKRMAAILQGAIPLTQREFLKKIKAQTE